MRRMRTVTTGALAALYLAGAGCAHSGSAGATGTRGRAARGWMDDSAVATAMPGAQGELPRVPWAWSHQRAVPVARGGGPQAPDVFAREVSARLRQIEAQVRADVGNQALAPQALDEVAARRVVILRLVREDGDDGLISPRERAQVVALLREMTERAYQYVGMPYVWPGGAQYWRQ